MTREHQMPESTRQSPFPIAPDWWQHTNKCVFTPTSSPGLFAVECSPDCRINQWFAANAESTPTEPSNPVPPSPAHPKDEPAPVPPPAVNPPPAKIGEDTPNAQPHCTPEEIADGRCVRG